VNELRVHAIAEKSMRRIVWIIPDTIDERESDEPHTSAAALRRPTSAWLVKKHQPISQGQNVVQVQLLGEMVPNTWDVLVAPISSHDENSSLE